MLLSPPLQSYDYKQAPCAPHATRSMYFALRSNLRASCLPSKLFTEDSISQPTQSLKQRVPSSEFCWVVQIVGWDGYLTPQLNVLITASFGPLFPKGHKMSGSLSIFSRAAGLGKEGGWCAVDRTH